MDFLCKTVYLVLLLEDCRDVISPLLVEVGSLAIARMSIYGGPLGRKRCGKRLYFHGVTFFLL